MDAVISVFQFIQGLGVAVVMPIIIFILGLCFKTGVGKSLRAGLTVGVGFIGLNLVINSLLGTSLSPAVQEMVSRFGLNLSTIDVGWPASAAIAMGSTVGLIIIPLGIVVNMVMLFTNTTQTVDVDIWDYWHFAFTGALVAIVTDNMTLGIIAAVVNMVIVMVLGDVTAPEVEKSLGLPGVSLPHGFTTAYAPIAIIINAIIDKIPGINKIDINMDEAQKRFGVFGEPILIGSVLGIGIGLLAGYDVTKVLTLGVSLGATSCSLWQFFLMLASISLKKPSSVLYSSFNILRQCAFSPRPNLLFCVGMRKVVLYVLKSGSMAKLVIPKLAAMVAWK